MVQSEGNMSLKNPVTPPGIDPGTIQLIAQRLNHYATPGPFISTVEPSYPATQENLWQVAYVLILYSDTSVYPWRQSVHFLTNLCSQVHTTSSQHFLTVKDTSCPLTLNASVGNSSASVIEINRVFPAHYFCCKNHDPCDITHCCHNNSWGPVWRTYMSYWIDGSVCVAATNVSFIKHCTWNKTRGVSSVQCNCVVDVLVSSTHWSWLEV
jgi:hypothetical protein